MDRMTEKRSLLVHGPDGTTFLSPYAAMIIYGMGGHARVVADAAPQTMRLVFADDAHPPPDHHPMFLAIGSNRARQRLAERFSNRTFPTICHRASSVSRDASVGPGTLLAAGSVVCAAARIGAHAIINTRASVDHDCRVDSYAHVAPGATLCGNVHVEEGAFVGAGSVVVDCHRKGHAHGNACGIRIGAWSLVRAGTVVQADVPAGATVGPGVWRG